MKYKLVKFVTEKNTTYAIPLRGDTVNSWATNLF